MVTLGLLCQPGFSGGTEPTGQTDPRTERKGQRGRDVVRVGSLDMATEEPLWAGPGPRKPAGESQSQPEDPRSWALLAPREKADALLRRRVDLPSLHHFVLLGLLGPQPIWLKPPAVVRVIFTQSPNPSANFFWKRPHRHTWEYCFTSCPGLA